MAVDLALSARVPLSRIDAKSGHKNRADRLEMPSVEVARFHSPGGDICAIDENRKPRPLVSSIDLSVSAGFRETANGKGIDANVLKQINSTVQYKNVILIINCNYKNNIKTTNASYFRNF
jgi:hypothetical protein